VAQINNIWKEFANGKEYGFLDRNSDLPLHLQLVNILKKIIESGELKPGQEFPGEAHIERLFNTSRITVRKALQKLTDLGYIYREQGRATIIQRNYPIITTGHRLGHLHEELEVMGFKVSHKYSGFKWANTPKEKINEYQFFEVEKVFTFNDVFFADGVPITIARNFLAADPNVFKLDIEDLEARDFYEILANDYNMNIINAEQIIKAELADKFIADLLGIKKGEPVLVFDTIAITGEGKTVLYVEVTYNTKSYKPRQIIPR